MSAARLVMMEWPEQYNNILAQSGQPDLLEVYVDDGRQAGRVFRKEVRYDPTLKKMILTEEARFEDDEMNESNN